MATMIQNNFVSGEISPSLYGRSDLAAYYHACAAAENFVVSREGSLRKRHGIGLTATVQHPYSKCRVVPYVYDRNEAGVVVFWLDDGDIKAELRKITSLDAYTSSVTVYEYNREYPATAATAWNVKNIRCAQIGDTLFTSVKGLFNVKIVVSWSTPSLAVSNFVQQSVPSPVSSLTATTPLPYGNERTITYGAYVCKNGVLSNVKTASVTMSKVWQAGYYVDITVTHGQSLVTKDFDYILIGKKSGSFFGELARFYPEDVTAATVTFQDENHTPSDVIYAQTNVLGTNFMPPLVTNAFQQRLVFANAQSGGSDLPMTLWFSSVGNLYNFYADRPAADDDPFSPTLTSTGPSFIRWIVPYQMAMVVFTDAGIFSVSGSANEGFGASTCRISKLSNLSVSQDVQPIETEAGIVFVGSDNKTLYTLAYDLQSDATRPANRMMMVRHITRQARITSIALQQYPDQVVWCALSDGTLASFTFDRREDENISAWSRHRSSLEDVAFLDVVGTGSVTDSQTDHTYGDIVFVGDAEVSDSFMLGTFRSDWKDSVWRTSTQTVTANVVSRLVTLPAESTSETISFRRKNVKDVLVRLFESGPIKVAPEGTGLAVQTLNPSATAQSPFTGDGKVKPTGYFNDAGQMSFVSDTDTNAEILAVIYRMEVD